jgi:hypothetical protein
MVQRNSQPCLRSASLNIYFGSDVGKLYTDGIQATTAHQQEQIEALAAGLQKVSAQLEASKAAPQVVNNNQ